MKIIDSHAHLGYDTVFDVEQTEAEIVHLYNTFGVFGAVIQPFIPRPYIKDTRDIHDRIHHFCLAHLGRFYGMASINPHFTQEDYAAEARRCITELGFKAIKITPIAHAAHPSSKDGLFVFETARTLGVPVMVHTGAGAPFSDPMSLVKALRMYGDVTTIFAHAGTDAFFQQALYLAQEFEQVYLEPSWVSIMNVEKAIHTLGAEKVMFSADHCINVPVELAKYNTILEGDDEKLQRVLAGTANEVFALGVL